MATESSNSPARRLVTTRHASFAKGSLSAGGIELRSFARSLRPNEEAWVWLRGSHRSERLGGARSAARHGAPSRGSAPCWHPSGWPPASLASVSLPFWRDDNAVHEIGDGGMTAPPPAPSREGRGRRRPGVWSRTWW